MPDDSTVDPSLDFLFKMIEARKAFERGGIPPPQPKLVSQPASNPEGPAESQTLGLREKPRRATKSAARLTLKQIIGDENEF